MEMRIRRGCVIKDGKYIYIEREGRGGGIISQRECEKKHDMTGHRDTGAR